MGDGRETRVDIAGLVKSAQALGAICEDLGMSFHRIEGLSSKALGSRRIDGALNQFAGHWKYGWGVMEQKLKETSTQLHAAARQYEAVESTLARAFMGPMV
jgi:hypothetical protein